MNEYLLSCGTTQRDKVQLELFGRLLTGTKDVLIGYKTSAIEITDESFLSKGEQPHQLRAVISNDNNAAMEGTVFELSEEEFLLADKYEPDGYEMSKVTLLSGKQAWVYMSIAV